MNVEDRLRAVLADDELALPAWPDPVSRVHAGIARRRRWRRLVGSFLATALAIVTAGVVSTAVLSPAAPQPSPSPVSPTTGVVAWIDHPVGDEVLFPGPTARPSARPCTANDLPRTISVNQVGAMGHIYTQVTLENAGASRCTLAGSPRLIGTNTKTGARGAISTQHTDANPVESPLPAIVDPGEPAILFIVSGLACDGGLNTTTYRNVSLQIFGRSYPLDHDISTTCPLEMTDWVLNVAFEPPPTPDYAELIPTLDAPATVRIGEPFSFTVTLRNPTDKPIRLNPCPAYEVGVYKSATRLWLNCPVGGIPANGSLRFAMVFTATVLPPPEQQAYLTWQLIDYNLTTKEARIPVRVVP
jgi:hypothetical protein